MAKDNDTTPLEQERDEKHALSALADTDGGKQLIHTLRTDVVRFVEQLSREYRTADHFELVRICADLNASLTIYRALSRAKKHVKELDEALEEILTDTDT